MDKDLPEDRETVAAGYVRYAHGLRTDADPDAVWAPESDPDCRRYEIVDSLVRQGPPELAWDLVRAVLVATADEDLEVSAAGPLEDLIRHHGAALLDSVEREAAADERFRSALGKIWLSEADLPKDVLDRLVHASGGALKVLERLPKRPSVSTPRNDR